MLLPNKMLQITARPFPIQLKLHQTVLIVIDMQRDFLEPGGYADVAIGNDINRVRPIIPIVARLINLFRSHQLPIIHVRQCHKSDLSDCSISKRMRGSPSMRIGDVGPIGRLLIDGEKCSEFIDECKPIGNEIVVTKTGKGMFYATTIDQILSNIDAHYLVFAGVSTDVCVQTSMREANDRGFDCLLIEDATDSYFDGFKDAAIAMMTAQNAIIGWTTTIEQFESDLVHM